MGEKIPGFVGTSWMQVQQRELILDEIPGRGRFLEIGTGCGTTIAYWASKRPHVEFVSVDAFKAAKGTGPGVLADWMANHQPNQVLFIGTAPQWAAFCREVFDVVFVDAGHGEEDVLLDLAAVTPLVAPGGALLVHDYGHPHQSLKAVHEATDAFCERSDWYVETLLYRTALLRAGNGAE